MKPALCLIGGYMTEFDEAYEAMKKAMIPFSNEALTEAYARISYDRDIR